MLSYRKKNLLLNGDTYPNLTFVCLPTKLDNIEMYNALRPLVLWKNITLKQIL